MALEIIKMWRLHFFSLAPRVSSKGTCRTYKKQIRFSTNNTADSENLITKESNGQFRAGRKNKTGRIVCVLLLLKCHVGKTSVSDKTNQKGGDDRAAELIVTTLLC